MSSSNSTDAQTAATASAKDAPISEKVIRKLESSGDFVVLRRLQSPPPEQPSSGPFAKVIVLDTETTGLDSETDKTIEIAMIAVQVEAQTGRYVRTIGTLECLEDPGFPLEPHTVALTGLTDADLKGKRFDEAAIAAFFKDADLVIAHGATHDRPFIEARLPQHACLPWGCSLDQVDWNGSGMGSAKLEFLAFKLGLFYKAHRALIDCMALLHVVTGHKLPTGQTVLQSLIDRSTESDFQVCANGAPFEKKDMLRANGYRWDADRRVWHIKVAETRLDDEFIWLHREVYGGRSARVQVEMRNAWARYSHNPPQGSVKSEMRSIGTQGDRPAMTASAAGRVAGSARY
jgi:DNA polymerase-3 subunit epsilon